jgi:hypothetical protein
MNTLGTEDEQVARLQGLLKRIQLNAAALRTERSGREAIAVASVMPISDAAISSDPTTAPTGTIPPRSVLGTLPDFLTQPEAAQAATENAFGDPEALAVLDANEPVTQVPPPFEPVVALTDVPLETDLPLDSLESDLPTLPPSRDDDFQDSQAEHTKPLWLGLNEGTATFGSEATDSSRVGDSHRTLAETPAAKVYDPPDEQGGVDIDVDAGFGEEEHLDTSPPISGDRASSHGAELSVVTDGSDDLEQELEVSPADVDQSGARISDAPPSVIGATITLPEESSAVSLELLEAPPSSRSGYEPAYEDELEAELPRNSFRAGYDASLSAPPGAAEDLRARDFAEQQRRDMDDRLSRAPERVEVGRVAEDDLPPVLSLRPASPSGSVRAVGYAPAPEAVGAVFEGSRPELRSLAFLDLLDASLAITTKH